MANITETQDVKLFIDEKNIGTQEVHISLDNWNKLVALAEKAKSRIPNAV